MKKLNPSVTSTERTLYQSAILILLLLLFLVKSCCKDVPYLVTTTDTIRTVDTVFFPVKVPHRIYVDRPVIKEKVIRVVEGEEKEVNYYSNEISDSLIDGTIEAAVDGTLLDVTLTYVPKFPKYIYEKETITNTVIDNRMKFYGGITFGAAREGFLIAPEISVFKHDFGFSAGYTLGGGMLLLGVKSKMR